MLRNSARLIVLLLALIGLALASFGTVPLVNASDVSRIGSPVGAAYVGTVSSGVITLATADWNQPAVTCQPNLDGQGERTGIYMSNSSTFYFMGTEEFCLDGTPVYSTETAVNGATSGVFVLTVNPEDEFSASFTFSPSTQILTAKITDISTGQSASATFPQAFSPGMPTLASWTVNRLGNLAQFNVPIRFSNCTVTVSGRTFTISRMETLLRVTMVDSSGNTMASTSSLSRAGSSFKVTWIGST